MARIYISVLSFLIANLCVAQFSVGHTTITFNDPTRTGGFGSGGGAGRQIQTELYYPATTAGENVPIENGEFPVIVFGHGFAMTWEAYANIWEHYAPMGYILAFPRTEGGLFPGPSHSDFGLDLRIVGEKLIGLNSNAASLFYQKLNGSAAIMGHSMGGGASILAANGNSNIKTVVGLAPAETSPSAISAAAGVVVPALVFSGSSDGVTPPEEHHLPIYTGLNSLSKTYISITGGGHCYFANSNFNCDFGEATSSNGIAINRDEQHAIVYSLLDLWLDYTLKGNCPAYDEFLQLAAQGTAYTAQSTHLPYFAPAITVNGSLLSSSVSGTAYQWYLNGIGITGANSIDYTATETGTYSVVVTRADGCVTESAPYVLNSLAMTEESEIGITLDPNPTDGLVNIGNMNGIEPKVSVRDMSGKEQVYRLACGILDLSECANGFYLVGINNRYFRILKVNGPF